MDTAVRLQVTKREPFADGISFGDVGAYERLTGRVVFEVDPEAPGYTDVVDLECAPRNSNGLVEYSSDLYILKPVELARSNRRLVYDVNNRGNKRIVQFMNDASHSNDPSSVAHAGNGFLMRRGYSVVWSGWQGDILAGNGRLTMSLPVATYGSGEITGTVRAEFIADESGVVCFPLSGNDYTASYEATSLDTSSATLTRREYERDPRIPIPRDQWRLAMVGDEGSTVPSSMHCYLPAGFEAGWIYELVYTAKNPMVMGLGFTGVRDLASFLLHDEVDDDGEPNPLAENGNNIEKAYSWGRSQSGRFLREFVYRGFNQDRDGRRVFDGVSPHVSGGGRVFLNYRFAQPGRYPRQHSDHLYPSDQFPFAYAVTTDRHTGKTDGILKRPETDPVIIHTQTSSEYWERRGSLVHTDSAGNDLADHARSRVYLFAGSQHGADPLEGPQTGPYLYISNPNQAGPPLRALLDALDEWATNGTAPPDSRVPTRTAETAVPAEIVRARFPSISDVTCPDEASRLYVQDHGPEFDSGIVSTEPPQEDTYKEYTVLVPQVDADGNEVPGVRMPTIEVPLATYTGWNYRPPGGAAKALAGVVGTYVPFPVSEDDRRTRGDGRKPTSERYRSKDHYVQQVAQAAQRLVDQRLLLAEDANRYVELATKEEAFD